MVYIDDLLCPWVGADDYAMIITTTNIATHLCRAISILASIHTLYKYDISFYAFVSVLCLTHD